jgi:hypothetical protein
MTRARNNTMTGKIKSTTVFCAALLLTAANVLGQTSPGNLGNEDVTVVKDYQPVLNDAFKISILPAGDTSTAHPAPLNYNTEPAQMNTAFNITPIKPVRIKDDNIKKLYRGYVKAGYGNYNTPLLDVRYNSLRSKEFDAGVHAKHISSSGKLKGYGYGDYSVNTVGVNGTRYFSENALKGVVDYNRDVYHYYGYKSPPELFTKNETRHLMNLFEGSVGFYSTHNNKDRLNYTSDVLFTSYNDNQSTDETMIGFKAGGGKRVYDGYATADAEVYAMHVKQPHQDNKRTLFQLTPSYQFKKDRYYLSAGLRLAAESGDYIDSELHLYPQATASADILSDEISVFAILGGGLTPNTVAILSRDNPYMNNFTPLVNTNEKLSLTGGINARISKEMMFTASAKFGSYERMAYYYNTIGDDEPVKYSVIYDDASRMELKAGIDYSQSAKTGISLTAAYDSYNNDSLDKPLFKPAFKIGLKGFYSISEKILINAELHFNDGAYALEYVPENIGYKKLDSYIDFSAGVDYRYSKILSFFVQANNIGMQRYFRWYNYPSFRLNAMAGLTYSFW